MFDYGKQYAYHTCDINRLTSLPPEQTPWGELLSALSPEERALLRAITDRGYPLHTAFIALQKTGQLAPDQVRTRDTGRPTTCPVDSSCVSV